VRVTLSATSKVVRFNGAPARVWEGNTSSGELVVALVPVLVPAGALVERSRVTRALADVSTLDPPRTRAGQWITDMVVG
jgi:hypothetical protein